jgi:hypothetical protein
MAGPWTSPDPLTNQSVTKSIYITELQDCVNDRRAEISQPLITDFIDQSVDATIRLDAIEELKTNTAQLALDFGYVGGIQHIDLLGRDWSDYARRNGNPVTSNPIINDLRQVLESLVDQNVVGFDTPAFVSSWWYDVDINVVSTQRPMANWSQRSGNPWATTPLDFFIPLGIGNTYPTFRGTVSTVSDIALIYFDFTSSSSVEGPLGGPFYKRPALGNLIDKDYVYTKTGPTVFRQLRDGSQPAQALSTLSPDPDGSSGLGPTYFYNIDSGTALNYARVNKTTGATVQFTESFLNITGVDTGLPLFVVLDSQVGFGRPEYKDGGINVVYSEEFRYFNGVDWTWTVASAIIRIPDSAVDGSTIVVAQDLAVASVTGLLGDVVLTPKHQTMEGIGNGGFWYDVRENGATAINTTITTPTANNLVASYNGTAIEPSNDYLGNNITNYGQFDTIDHWNAMTGGATSDFIDPNSLVFDTAVRTNVGFNDEVNVTWTHVPGIFRYRLQRKLASSSVWITTSTIESIDVGSGGTITGLQKAQDYDIRLLGESGQGAKEGIITFVETVIPNKPTITSAIPATNSIQVSWSAPVGPQPVTGYNIRYRIGFGPFTTIDVGLVLTHNILGLASGTEYKIQVAAYNLEGEGNYSDQVIVTTL